MPSTARSELETVPQGTIQSCNQLSIGECLKDQVTALYGPPGDGSKPHSRVGLVDVPQGTIQNCSQVAMREHLKNQAPTLYGPPGDHIRQSSSFDQAGQLTFSPAASTCGFVSSPGGPYKISIFASGTFP